MGRYCRTENTAQERGMNREKKMQRKIKHETEIRHDMELLINAFQQFICAQSTTLFDHILEVIVLNPFRKTQNGPLSTT
jgi:hypothetical protein